MAVTATDIDKAHDRIRPHIRRTPVFDPGPGSFGLSHPVHLKLELLQHTGSFKPRGAFYTLLTETVPEAGVVAASGGNHGIAVGHAASRLGHRAEIFVPGNAPAAKVTKIAATGATVHQIGSEYADALAAAQAHRARTGALDVHAYDSPTTIAGQGTVGLEWSEQAELDTVLVAIGGGGLIAGIAAFYASRVRVVGVEPVGIPTLHAALQAGEPVDVDVRSFAADSLGARRIGAHVFPIAQAHVDHVALVPDEGIREAQERLRKETGLVVEPGGATALAALISGAYTPAKGERVGVLVCGGNAPR
ncbi:MAG: threonine dehydratase [Deltaproteobacteria bacterium]|nr:threonine dehydratase [Deltaproteobacteria bacterium]HCH65980.1 threonine dehydratase [Deltaproteobacteria bacterium]